jgi:hypothetical protein
VGTSVAVGTIFCEGSGSVQPARTHTNNNATPVT